MKIRDDITVGSLEKKLGLPAGTFRNKNGRKTRKDKKLRSVKRDFSK